MSLEAMVAVMMISMCSLFGYVSYSEGEVKKACYAAMQHNPQLQCNRP